MNVLPETAVMVSRRMARQQRAVMGARVNVLSRRLVVAVVVTQLLLQFASTTTAKDAKMASLDNLVKENVVGDVIDAKPATSLTVEYPSGVHVEQGNELKPTQVKDQPQFTLSGATLDKNKLYTLAMVDPDAPSRKEPRLREILHFLETNIPGDGDHSIHTTKGVINAEYIGSGPPQGTGLHRYIFLLFEQKARVESSLKIPKTSRNGRINFSIRKFAKENHLGEPIAANFYQAQYDDYVPTLHAQLSQG